MDDVVLGLGRGAKSRRENELVNSNEGIVPDHQHPSPNLFLEEKCVRSVLRSLSDLTNPLRARDPFLSSRISQPLFLLSIDDLLKSRSNSFPLQITGLHPEEWRKHGGF